MEFNNKLYELRKKRGYSQEELANRLNVSRQTVSKWEVGESAPDMEKLVAISDLFEVSLDELVKDKVPEQAQPQEQLVKSEFYSDLKKHVLTQENKKKTQKGLKIAGIAFGVFLLVDFLTFLIYVLIFGLPQ
ncbi:MAG: helix-turn-helix transcriptional regulator [Lachnospiraceae bacterium]|nr:helix-turn-helix transcriptional regulator [Lachnospiraceae bacterium]MBR3508805.1 helix-turn-helix transcriptional regulator [Lachnospiraceae bacterium]MBR4608344.1 helix-turn-helix transcriptional regulator [Lachnospiraceae bacterium]